MWWLLIQCEKRCLQVSLIDQHVQLQNLVPFVKICKYRRLYKKHHFISMAMEVHGAPRCDMDYFIKECVHLFHNRWSRGHLSLFFCIQFFKHLNITFQDALAFVIERKIALTSDACSKPPITIRSHHLHANDIRGTVGDFLPREGLTLSLFLVLMGCLSLTFLFCVPSNGSNHQSLIAFLFPFLLTSMIVF
jgi:hypothetical protein